MTNQYEDWADWAGDNTQEAEADLRKERREMSTIDAWQVRELADQLVEEKDPDYKDEWERGHDAGMVAAGRALHRLLDSAAEASE
jgi:major membrane immunogen (membrane-anchored lipoprotein)